MQGTMSRCSSEVSPFPGASRGTNLIFGYQFKPKAGGSITALLIAQTDTGGCLRKCFSNQFFQFFLYLYLRNLEQNGLAMIESGTASEFVE